MELSKDSFRKRKRAWFMALGSLSIFFLFGTILVLPLFQGRSGLDAVSYTHLTLPTTPYV